MGRLGVGLGESRVIGDWRLEIGEGVGMEVVTAVTGAVMVYGGLVGVSVWFNGRIDGVPVQGRPDGVTALWVMVGVGYTLAGSTVLVWLGWPVVALLAGLFGGLGGSLAVLVVLVSAFVASGLPMLWGDMRRSHGVRTVSEAIRVARGELRGADHDS